MKKIILTLACLSLVFVNPTFAHNCANETGKSEEQIHACCKAKGGPENCCKKDLSDEKKQCTKKDCKGACCTKGLDENSKTKCSKSNCDKSKCDKHSVISLNVTNQNAIKHNVTNLNVIRQNVIKAVEMLRKSLGGKFGKSKLKNIIYTLNKGQFSCPLFVLKNSYFSSCRYSFGL